MTTRACRKSKKKHTPFVSKAQTKAGGVAYAAKKGKIPVSALKGASRKMYENMTIEELRRHIKEAKGKKMPRYVKERKAYQAKRKG